MKQLFNMLFPRTVELCLTDFCNLACPNCSQSVPLVKAKTFIPLSRLAEMADAMVNSDVKAIKLSGGEPTLHPQFGEAVKLIANKLPQVRLTMATNGARLLKHKEVLPLISVIYLSLYPGLNDQAVTDIVFESLPNVTLEIKRHGVEMRPLDKFVENVTQETCVFAQNHKVVGNRIYPCCAAHGISIRQGFDPNDFSVPFDGQWAKRLKTVQLGRCCEKCFMGATFKPARTVLTSLDRNFFKKAKGRMLALLR